MKVRNYIYFLLIISSVQIGYSQSATDIFLLKLQLEGSSVSVHTPKNITQRDGYDNQASFTPTSTHILYTSIREDQQADIYQYEIATEEIGRLTQTPETSEYSPKVMRNGKYFSVVRVEKDGKTQRLWKFPLKTGKASVLLPKVKPVGYYTWYKPDHVAMFILGNPNTLKYTDLKKQTLEGFEFNLGRSLHTIPGTESVSYVDKSNPDIWYIKSWDSKTGASATLTETLQGKEDYCWTPTGLILMGKEGHLFVFNPDEKSKGWKDLGDLNIGDFYRLACSPDGKHLTAVSSIETK